VLRPGLLLVKPATTADADAIAFRVATESDLPAIHDVLSSNGLPTSGVAEALCGFLAATVNGVLIGTVGMEYCGAYGLLRSTAVVPEWRGRGVARQLVERIVAEAERRGIHALYLLTTTAETYFPSFGFQVTTRAAVPDEIRATGEFKDACPQSATVMCLTLADE
jgi:amino-acid N-acetyltransferase